MGTWFRRNGWRNASKPAREILREVEKELLVRDDPRLIVVSIRIGARKHDYHDFEVGVELAAGATVAVRYQSVNEEGRNPDRLDGHEGSVSWQVGKSVQKMRALGVDVLADTLHDMRVSARKILAGWSADSGGAVLVDIRFVETEHSSYDNDECTFEVRLRCLDTWLRSTVVALEIDQPEELESTLAAWWPRMQARFDLRSALARQGADAMVDQLVVNALDQQCEATTALRYFSNKQVSWSNQGLFVDLREGHFRCSGRSHHGAIEWDMDTLTMRNVTLPDTAILALRGRPITALVEHPVLSANMIISDISLEDGSIRVHLDQPRLLFCSASGRVWATKR